MYAWEQNKTKQNKTKQNKTKQNKAKRSDAKRSEAKRNETKRNETKQNKSNILLFSAKCGLWLSMLDFVLIDVGSEELLELEIVLDRGTVDEIFVVRDEISVQVVPINVVELSPNFAAAKAAPASHFAWPH
eukprot:SAG11_NODE_474_length_9142_cov_6.507907_5_plen_131_part_00